LHSKGFNDWRAWKVGEPPNNSFLMAYSPNTLPRSDGVLKPMFAKRATICHFEGFLLWGKEFYIYGTKPRRKVLKTGQATDFPIF